MHDSEMAQGDHPLDLLDDMNQMVQRKQKDCDLSTENVDIYITTPYATTPMTQNIERVYTLEL